MWEELNDTRRMPKEEPGWFLIGIMLPKLVQYATTPAHPDAMADNWKMKRLPLHSIAVPTLTHEFSNEEPLMNHDI